MIRKFILLVFVAVFCAMIYAACIHFFQESPRPTIAVRNSTHQEILTRIKITLSSYVDGKQQVIDVPALSPNQSVDHTIHINGDPKLEIEYTFKGRELKRTYDYIDLWSSDTWLIEIGDDGNCTGRYWTDRPLEAAAE